MPFEEIEVRITKKGEVFVRVFGGTEERLRDYFEFLEENVGPIRHIERLDRPDWEQPAATSGERAENETEERHRELGG